MHGEQWEMIVLLRGRFDFLIFDPQAELVQRLAMSVASPVVQIPRGTWHSGVALAPETLVLEVKPGTYRPNEFAAWAPEEGEPASGVNAPVDASTENPAIAPASWLTLYKCSPAGSISTPRTAGNAAKGDPGSAESAPVVWSMANAFSAPSDWFAT